MDPLTLNDVITFGAAATISIVLLRMVFKFLKTWQEKQLDYQDNGSSGARGKKSSYMPTDYTVLNNQLLKQMALQIEEMHETISVTKSFQRAFTSMAHSAEDQTKILKELSEINTKNLEILEYLALMTGKIDKDRVRKEHLKEAVENIKKSNGEKE